MEISALTAAPPVTYPRPATIDRETQAAILAGVVQAQNAPATIAITLMAAGAGEEAGKGLLLDTRA